MTLQEQRWSNCPKPIFGVGFSRINGLLTSIIFQIHALSVRFFSALFFSPCTTSSAPPRPFLSSFPHDQTLQILICCLQASQRCDFFPNPSELCCCPSTLFCSSVRSAVSPSWCRNQLQLAMWSATWPVDRHWPPSRSTSSFSRMPPLKRFVALSHTFHSLRVSNLFPSDTVQVPKGPMTFWRRGFDVFSV